MNVRPTFVPPAGRRMAEDGRRMAAGLRLAAGRPVTAAGQGLVGEPGVVAAGRARHAEKAPDAAAPGRLDGHG